MASALETLCGQAFGAKQSHMLGIYLQRSWIVVLSCTILLLPLFIFTSPLLRLLGQDESIASMAGVAGAMGSMVLAFWIPIFGQFGFLIFGGCPDTWKGFSMSAFHDLWPVIKLSLSSGAMVCLEVWYNAVLVLLTGYMKNAEVEIDALSICININGWALMISLGFLAAAGVRVANELGAGSAKAVKFSILVVVSESLSIGIVFFVLFLEFRNSLAYVFTENQEVAMAVADLSPLLAFSIILNSIQPVLSGVAVGSGWQSLVAYVNVASYYLIGVPLGVVLGYVIGYQVKGIWIGMIVGTAVQTIVLIFITWRTDWHKQVNQAQARVNRWLLPTSEERIGGREAA
ncbi:uncharacterized protein A4U43_UnF320 [Asparagus officinalis]|uniref:Protein DETOXIFICATION n=1 Tax=Asparagus officinalis TaxID=4686 RepID=A0A1R3L7U5_ASPOF|nr:uncharacterized protein A4U43_UnF320 [Asparagus officinalis]